MRSVAMLFGVAAACCGAPGLALDIDPGTRTKAVAAAASASAAAAAASAPVIAPGSHNPLPDLPNGMDVNGRNVSGACAQNTADLCYDYKENRIVYRPSRNWMPAIEGLKAEHISVRRDSVVFRYSFR